MQNKLNERYLKGKKFILDLFLRQSSSTSKNLCCISIASNEFTFLYGRFNSGKFEIELLDTYECDTQYNLKAVLANIVKTYQLKMVPCTWILQPDDYQLILTDELPVSASEFQAAIRWKIKDLIHIPLEETIVDSFAMPKALVEATKKIMVVVTRNSFLRTMSEQILNSGLDLTIIDIPELALRNISALFEQDSDSTALIYVQEKNIQLLITYQQQLYFTRRLMFSFSDTMSSLSPISAEMEQNTSKLSLELQRSFDYYQSQWRQQLPSRVLFASTQSIPSEFIADLSKKLNTEVKILNALQFFQTNLTISAIEQGKYLPNIGGVLRGFSFEKKDQPVPIPEVVEDVT